MVSEMDRAVLIVCVAMVAALSSVVMAVDIETVPVGNVGNAGDVQLQGTFGAVDYAYNIGKYEVTAGQYTEFLNAVASTDPYGLYNGSMDNYEWGCQITRHGDSGSYTYDFSGGTVEAPGSTAANWENRPVSEVSWGDAARFANWLHNGQPTGTLTGDPAQDAGLTEDGAYFMDGATSDAELLTISREPDWKWVIPSEDEWYKAAHHKNDGVTGNYFDCPTSSDIQPGYVDNSGNLSGTGNPFTEGGTDPGNYATWDGDGTTWDGSGGTTGIGSPYYHTEVGEWENSDSPYGTFDQGGNVSEWNEAVIGGEGRGLRGGSFRSGVRANYLRASYRYYDDPKSGEGFDFGFRVVQVPEPTTLSLLALGVLAMLRRRKRGAKLTSTEKR